MTASIDDIFVFAFAVLPFAICRNEKFFFRISDFGFPDILVCLVRVHSSHLFYMHAAVVLAFLSGFWATRQAWADIVWGVFISYTVAVRLLIPHTSIGWPSCVVSAPFFN
jgi:hypothetical protein